MKNLLIGKQNRAQGSTTAQLLHPAALFQPECLHLVHEQLFFRWLAHRELEIVFDKELHGRVANSVLSGEFSYASQWISRTFLADSQFRLPGACRSRHPPSLPVLDAPSLLKPFDEAMNSNTLQFEHLHYLWNHHPLLEVGNDYVVQLFRDHLP